jgi:hypothetical protein
MIKSRHIPGIARIWITFILFSSGLILSCTHSGPGRDEQVTRHTVPAELFPDYAGVTVPPNIAPLNFAIREEGERFAARWEGSDGTVIAQSSRKGIFRIPAGKWHTLLQGSRGESVVVSVFRKERGQWLAYPPFQIHVAEEEIDPYLVYRLIPPGYETWSNMGLYQREISTFREKPVIENTNADDNCVNCHSFNWGNSDEILFHVRGSIGGTMIGKGDEIEKVDLKREETLSAGVYPSWHPAGNLIAFSTNRIEQYFHARPGRSIEVMDRQSDLILYHIKSGEVTHVPGTGDDRFMETYPAWSPDGSCLYFSRADANEDTPFDSIRYNICRIAFDPGSGRFIGEAETVFDAARQGWSASFPRISPDGRYLLCTVHSYGTFPIWHREADLCMVDLSSGSWHLPEGINSDDTESFHSWSANTRWVVVSSRRDDGRYTKPYISYLDSSGTFRKAFLIPQRNPRSYDLMMTSFNRPELITGPVKIPPRKWIRAVKKEI